MRRQARQIAPLRANFRQVIRQANLPRLFRSLAVDFVPNRRRVWATLRGRRPNPTASDPCTCRASGDTRPHGYRERTKLDNVEFRLGEIEHLPVADSSVDVAISNCVLNLSPDKVQVWREIARVLRPGGRVAVSDLALLRPLPADVLKMVEALVGCVAGAVLVEATRSMMDAAGLPEIQLTPKRIYVEAMSDAQDPLYRKILEHLPAGSSPSDYITSMDISARKREA